LNGFIRNRGGLCAQQSVGELRLRGEVQEGEQQKVRAEVLIFTRDRFLDFDHHLRLVPGRRGVSGDGCSLGGVVIVRDSRTNTRSRLHGDLVTVGDEIPDTCRGHRNPEFIVLDFADNRNLHAISPQLWDCVVDSRPRESTGQNSIESCTSETIAGLPEPQ
jgi:hypothetical protein